MVSLRVFLLFSLLLTLPVWGQRKTKLNTNSKGTLFGYFGYNRSAYSQHGISFQSTDYDFSLSGVKFTDNPKGESISAYFDQNGFNSFQFNGHVGYFVKHKLAITLGIDRLNQFMVFGPDVRLTGTVAPNTHGFLAGTYDNATVDDVEELISYRQESGVNFVRLGLMHSTQRYKSKKAEFSVYTNLGGGVGLLFADVDYFFNDLGSTQATSMSGIGLVGNGNIRLVAYQHVFLQLGLSGGLLNQRNISLRNNTNEQARHFNAYISPEIAIGVNIFARPSDCGTCPQW